LGQSVSEQLNMLSFNNHDFAADVLARSQKSGKCHQPIKARAPCGDKHSSQINQDDDAKHVSLKLYKSAME